MCHQTVGPSSGTDPRKPLSTLPNLKIKSKLDNSRLGPHRTAFQQRVTPGFGSVHFFPVHGPQPRECVSKPLRGSQQTCRDAAMGVCVWRGDPKRGSHVLGSARCQEMQSRTTGMGRHLLLNSGPTAPRAQPAATRQEAVWARGQGRVGLQGEVGACRGRGRGAPNQLLSLRLSLLGRGQ